MATLVLFVVTSGSPATFNATLDRLYRRARYPRTPDFRHGGFETQRVGRYLHLVDVQHYGVIVDIGHNCQTAEIGDDLSQKFETLSRKIGRLIRQTSHVSARPRETGDQAVGNRISRDREDDPVRVQRSARCGPRPNNTQSRYCDLQSSRVRAIAVRKRRPIPAGQKPCSPPRKPMVGSLLACCARAARGHTAAAPPRSVMNSRRCMSSPKLRRRDPNASNEYFDRAQTGRQNHCRSAQPMSLRVKGGGPGRSSPWALYPQYPCKQTYGEALRWLLPPQPDPCTAANCVA